MGMPYDLFWDGEAEAAKYYREADRIRFDRENEQRWLQGIYVYDAIGSLQPALNPFAKGKAKNYMDKPIELRQTKKPKSKSEERKQIDKGIAFMESFAIQFNKRFEERQGGESKNG